MFAEKALLACIIVPLLRRAVAAAPSVCRTVPRVDAFAYLRGLAQPTLVVNGSNDVIIYTVNSLILQQNLPNAQLILYPDSNHGSQYQYPALFVADVARFLDAETPFPIQKD